MLGQRPQRQGRKKGQGGDNSNPEEDHHAERARVGAQGTGAFGDVLFAAQQAGDGYRADDGQVAIANSSTTPQLMFHQGVLSPSPSKPEPLLAAEEVYS